MTAVAPQTKQLRIGEKQKDMLLEMALAEQRNMVQQLNSIVEEAHKQWKKTQNAK